MRKREPVAGGAFALDAPQGVPAIWGRDDQILWAAGESLMLCAPPGLGKTTLVQQLALRRIGVHEPELLGLPVAVDNRSLLYIAADRPAQAARSLRRMVTEVDRDVLDERLVVWPGPLPFRITDDPARLVDWLLDLDVGTVVVESLKDIAIGLAEDAVGAAVNQARQHVLAAGIEVVETHHQRKAQDGRSPRTLDDVYGSAWLTAGAGSVALLWGEAGDPIVELKHLKQPAGEVGPLELHHDHERGRTTAMGAVDLLDLAAGGVTAADAARAIYHKQSPDRNDVERVRRRLEKLRVDGALDREQGLKPKDPVVYRVMRRDTSRDAITPAVTRHHGSALDHITPGITAHNGASVGAIAPLLRGGVDPQRDLTFNGARPREAIWDPEEDAP